MITEIYEFNTPETAVYTERSERQLATIYEPQPGLFLAESPKVIGRALAAGYEPQSFLVEKELLLSAAEKHFAGGTGENADSPAAEAAQILDARPDVPVYVANFGLLSKITGFQFTGGFLSAMKRRPLPAAGEITKNARRIVVLEHVMNPTNVGAIMRSAAAFGMDAVLLTEGSTDPLYRRAARVSMGTVFQVPWTFVKDVEEVRALGFSTAAMALRENAKSIDDPALKAEKKLAVLMGSEETGLKKETIDAADHVVCIPMKNGVDSLNVAAAAALACWELA